MDMYQISSLQGFGVRGENDTKHRGIFWSDELLCILIVVVMT